MRRALATLLVAIPVAIVALLWVSPAATGQPVPAPGLRSVQHGSAFTGSGTTAAPLNLSPQACDSGSAVAGWGSDGTPTCVATGSIDGTGSAGKLTYWTDADTLGYGTGATSVQHQGSLSVTQDLSASGILYMLGKLSDSTGTGTSGQVLAVNGSGYPRWTTPTGDIAGITTTSPLSGGCTSGTCALTTSMSTARILGRTTASTGVVEQLTGTQATAMLDVVSTSAKGLVPTAPNDATKFLDGTGAFSVPPDHALVTSGVVPMGNGSTQVDSGIGVSGTTVTMPGDTDLTAGTTTVGAFGGTTQVSTLTGTQNDFALDADATTLRFSGATPPTLFGIGGGFDGRRLRIENNTASTMQIGIEGSGSTTSNRIKAFTTLNISAAGTLDLEYDGDAARWRASSQAHVQLLNIGSTLSVGSSATVSGAATFNGDVTIGNASTDTATVNAMMRLATGIATKSTSGPTAVSCGTSPTVVGSRTMGRVTLGAGTTTCELDFETAFSATPSCSVTFYDSDIRAAANIQVTTTYLAVGGFPAVDGGEIVSWICGDHF